METLTALIAGLATLFLFTTIAFAIELNTTQKTLAQYRVHASRLVRKEYTTRDTLTAVIDTLTIERDDALTSVEAYRVYCSRLIHAHNKTRDAIYDANKLERNALTAEIETLTAEIETQHEHELETKEYLRETHGKLIDAFIERDEVKRDNARLAYALLECATDECENTTALVVCDECTDEMTGHYESVKER